MEGELLQMRGRDLPSPLGLVEACPQPELPPAGLLRRDQVRGAAGQNREAAGAVFVV